MRTIVLWVQNLHKTKKIPILGFMKGSNGILVTTFSIIEGLKTGKKERVTVFRHGVLIGI